MNEHYENSDDKETIPKWFYLPHFDDCGKYREYKNNIRSHHPSHRTVITCNFCQNVFKMFNDREVRCSDCCWLIERKLKI